MLQEEQLQELFRNLELPELGRKYVMHLRSAPPRKRVEASKKSSPLRFASSKNGFTLELKDREHIALAYELEVSRAVFEFFDNIPEIKLNYLRPNGEPGGNTQFPSFFVITAEGIGWIDIRVEEKLVRLEAENPNRYFRDEQGNWRCPPGEQYAAKYGFFYKVRCFDQLDWHLQRNIRYLRDFYREDYPSPSSKAAHEILGVVAERRAIRLDELLASLECATPDDAYKLIVDKRIYVDLMAAVVAEPDQVWVYTDVATAQSYAVLVETLSREYFSYKKPSSVAFEEGATIVWDSKFWTIKNLGATHIWLRNEDGHLISLTHEEAGALVQQGKIFGPEDPADADIEAKAMKIVSSASEKDLAKALVRYNAVQADGKGLRLADLGVTDRTLRTWKRKGKIAECEYSNVFVGLISSDAKKGNRTPRQSEAVRKLIDEVISEEYEVEVRPTVSAVYGILKNLCDERGYTCPSPKTFGRKIKERDQYKQQKAREGEKAAYPHEPMFHEDDLTLLINGDRPWEIAHLDHTQLDIELVHSRTGKNLGRPWLTLLIDSYSRRILAAYLTYDPPSYRSCMMILRICVMRHGRLPETIVVDGGKEFSGIFFEACLAFYDSHKQSRAKTKPRFGAIIERLVGSINTQFIYNLQGNTQATKNVRQMTPEIDPKKKAIWTLGRLYVRVCEWCYKVYDNKEHSALGQTPHEAFDIGIVSAGKRPHRKIPYGELFIMMTLPTNTKMTAKIQASLGVKINYIYYWCDAFTGREHTEVPVRYDPFDIGKAYALVNGKWELCVSHYNNRFAGRTERELLFATEELRKQNQDHTRKFNVTALQLAEFLISLKAEEALWAQRQHDREARDIFTFLDEGRHATVNIQAGEDADEDEVEIAEIPSYMPFAPGTDEAALEDEEGDIVSDGDYRILEDY